MYQVTISRHCFGLIPLIRIMLFAFCSIFVLGLAGQEDYGGFGLGNFSGEYELPKEDKLSECEEIKFFRGEKVYDVFLDNQNFLWVLSESGVYRKSGEDFIDMSISGLELLKGSVLSNQKIGLPKILEGDYGNMYFLGDFRTRDMKHGILVYSRVENRMRTIELSSVLVAAVETIGGLILLLEKGKGDIKLVRCLFGTEGQVRPIANISLSENTSYLYKLDKVEMQGDSVLVFRFHGHIFLGFFFERNEIKSGFSNSQVKSFIESRSDVFIVDEGLFNGHELIVENTDGLLTWRVENNGLYVCNKKLSTMLVGVEKVRDVERMNDISYVDSVIVDSILSIALSEEGAQLDGQVNHVVDEFGTNWLQIDKNIFSWDWEKGSRSAVYFDKFPFEKKNRIPAGTGVLHRLYPNHEVFYSSISNFELIVEGLVSINIGDEDFISLGADHLQLIRVNSKYPIMIDDFGNRFMELDSGLLLISPLGEVDSVQWDSKYGNVSKILAGYNNNIWVITWNGILIYDYSWTLIYSLEREFICFSKDLDKSAYGNRRSNWVDVLFDGAEEWLVFLADGTLNVVNRSGFCRVIDLTRFDVESIYEAKRIAEDEILVFTNIGIFEICLGESIEYSFRYKIFNKLIQQIANPAKGVFVFSVSDTTFYQQVHWFDVNKGGGKLDFSTLQDFAGLDETIVYTKGNSVWWKSLSDLSESGKLIHKFTGRNSVSLKVDSKGNTFVLGDEAIFFVDKYWHPGVGRDVIYHVPFSLVDEAFKMKDKSPRKKYSYLDRFQKDYNFPVLRNNDEDQIFDVLGGIDENEYKITLDLFRGRFNRLSKKVPVPYFEKITVAAPENGIRQLRTTSVMPHSTTASLNANENDLEFRIGANYHINPTKVTYSYKLENWNEVWSTFTSNSVVSYPNLTPGTYTFKFFAMNEYGRSAAEPTTFTFTIRWPWYKTWTAWTGFLVGFLSIVYGTARYYINDKLRIQMAVEQEREQTRERLGDDFHDNAGQDLTKMQLMLGIARNNLVRDVEEISLDLSKMQATMTSLTNKIRDFTWSLKTDDNSLEDLCQRLTTAQYELFNLTDIKFVEIVNITEMEGVVLSPSIRQDVLLVFREVMNNCVKYSEANLVCLNVLANPITRKILISFEDDGVGFDPETILSGNGMHTLQKRAAAIGGELRIDAKISKGVKVSLAFIHHERLNK